MFATIHLSTSQLLAALSGNYSTTARRETGTGESRREKRREKNDSFQLRRKNMVQCYQIQGDFLKSAEIITVTKYNTKYNRKYNGKVRRDGVKSLRDCNFYLTALRVLSLLLFHRRKLVRYRVKAQRNIKGIVSPSALVPSVSTKLLFTDKGLLLSAPQVPSSLNLDRYLCCQFMRSKPWN